MQDESTLDTSRRELREMVRHEDEQTHRRLSWLGQLQGFLFAALSLAWDKGHAILYILSAMGISIALLVSIGLITATLAHERIRSKWRELRPKNYNGPELYGFTPLGKYSWTVFTSPENILPWVFVIGWTLVVVVALRTPEPMPQRQIGPSITDWLRPIVGPQDWKCWSRPQRHATVPHRFPELHIVGARDKNTVSVRGTK